MKTLVHWQGQGAQNAFRFLGHTEDGQTTALGSRGSLGTKDSASPKEVMAMAQSACTGIDVVSTLQKMREPLESLEISCEISLSKDYPSVFESCVMQYDVRGRGINPRKVAHAVELSLLKYCGVSAMIERSGCHLTPRLFVNNTEFSIWDPQGNRAQILRNWQKSSRENFPRGVALIVGGSRGIGRALVRQLSNQHFGIISASRTAVEGELAKNECERIPLDISNELSRSALVALIKESGVEISTVIFNSGILDSEMRSAANVNFDELRKVFETNLFAVADLNRDLYSLLSPRATILFISSYMGLPNSNDFNCSSYRLSKCALSLYAREFGKEMLAMGKDIAVASVHPGSVLTKLNPAGRLSPEESAARIAILLESDRRSEILARNGEFWMVKEKEARIDPWNI